ILGAVLASPSLQGLIDSALISGNPLGGDGCGFFSCPPRVTYNAGTITYDTPSSSLLPVPGGLQAQVTLPNVRLSVSLCGTAGGPGGTTVSIHASSINATVNFSLRLSGGLLRAGLQGPPDVTVVGVSLDGSGFCGTILDIIDAVFGIFTSTATDKIRDGI